MASVNKVILLGHLGKDPEIKNFEGGGMICEFPLATTESYFDREKNQRVELPTDWHKIKINKPGLVKVAQQFLHKGSQVFIEGVLRNRSYQTKEGETKYITEVHVNELVLTGSKSGQPESVAGQHQSTETTQSVPAVAGDDDLPF